MAKGNFKKKANRPTLEFEARLWAAAGKMRGGMEAWGLTRIRSINACPSPRKAANLRMDLPSGLNSRGNLIGSLFLHPSRFNFHD